MASRLYCCWTYLWIILFRSVSADSDSLPRYNISRYPANFDQATQNCSPGVLTTFATKQEISNILKLISDSVQGNFTFWIGLKKPKDACIFPHRPLRGFKWTEDGGEHSDVIHWAAEPQQTCTSVLCAALTGGFDRSAGSRWSLTAVTCKNKYHFICKLRDGLTRPMAENRETGVKTTTADPVPTTSEPKLETAAPPTPATQQRDLSTPEHRVPPSQGEPETDLNPTTGRELVGPDSGPGSGPALGSHLCEHPIIPEARSLSPDSDNNRVQVECWSNDLLELHCQGRPSVWRLPDESPANFTTICQKCEVGFKKDASAKCVDVDECGGGEAHCKHTCLNTQGSYRCVCADESGNAHEEDSPACLRSVTVEEGGPLRGVLVPVLVAVVALVVLVVIVTVIVKCCVMRRSKKKKAEKKAEKMAMKSKGGKESFITANEKTAK
ncbi:C-type lectin domain family 14 member A isoform X2 [Anabas testudineus]|nr:C-type lectin domain family 14 member A isoform X2 [Anabas testudineus]